MDRMLNSKSEKESIYEIYRACRLCGGGAGYKMPIIQNIVDLDEADVELKQKIRDCVQIEVHQDDKMPPLICELCVDKVNDFYEFLEMCRQTNKRTRLRLGLPPQSLPRGAPDAGDCILGLTEPVFVNEDSDGEPLSKHKKLNKTNAKREPIVRLKIEDLQETRNSRHKAKREPTPPRVTRNSKGKDDDMPLSSVKEKPKPSAKANTKEAPKSILKKDTNVKPESSLNLSPRLKRSRDKEPVKLETPPKKVKITIKPTPPPPPVPTTRQKPSPKPSPKSSPKSSPRFQPKAKLLRSRSPPPAAPPKRQASPPKESFDCPVCGQENKSSQARGNHLRKHTIGFTPANLACNPCGLWFTTAEEVAAHHKSHKTRHMPYNCRKCQADFKRLAEYDVHFGDNECLPSTEVPDVKCDVCWHLFPTNNLLDQHKCLGEDNRPGGKCSKCYRTYALQKNLKKHESTCTAKKKGGFTVDKELLNKLRPIQVRVARCDPLLVNVKQEHYDVSCVSSNYGLDSNCYYPYISGFRFPGMVDIQDDIKKVFCAEDYIHWDSTDTEDDDEDISCDSDLNPTLKKKQVESLSALTLKTIFSSRLIGKVPKKRRRIKPEKVFDSILNDNDEVRAEIGNLIDNLGDDDCDKVGDRTFDGSSLSQDVSVSSDKDIVKDCVNDSMDINVNDSTNDMDTAESTAVDDDLTNDSTIVDGDFNNSSQVTVNNEKEKSDVSSNSLNNDNDNKTDTITNSEEVLRNNEDNKEDLNEDSNSQSLLENNYTENTDNCQNNETDDPKNDNNSQNSDKNIGNMFKDDSTESNNIDTAKTNDKVDLDLSKNGENNDTVYNNDSRYKNDSINSSLLDEIDAQINDSNISKDSDSTNDKIVLEDLITKPTETRIGLGSIEDYSFDS